MFQAGEMVATVRLIRGQTHTLNLEKPKPKLDNVLKIQGYKNPDQVRPAIQQFALTAIDTFVARTVPTVTYRIVDIHAVEAKDALLGDGVHLRSPIFSQYHSRASEHVVFALTVGQAIDDQASEWMHQEKLIEALFLESAAWLGVENATKQFVLIIRKWAMQQSLRLTRRLGPGYSYTIDGQQSMWDLADPNRLFELLNEPAMPVQLLESAAMLPKMSRSGLFGLVRQSTA